MKTDPMDIFDKLLSRGLSFRHLFYRIVAIVVLVFILLAFVPFHRGVVMGVIFAESVAIILLLVKHVRSNQRLATIADELQRHEEDLRLQAFHDVLTGLPNRARLEAHLGSLLTSRRKSNRFALLFIDLDKFKKINDTLGHAMGDRLLREVATRLASAVRHDDMVARFAGDEFVVIGMISDIQDAEKIAEDIFLALLGDFVVDTYLLHVTVSIGIVLFPDHGVTLEELFKNADAALYRAKESGRNQYQFFGKHMAHEAFERISLESRLRQAIKNNELVLHYQPIVDVLKDQIVGAEALIRWQHPQRGLLYPSEFISLAEDTGSIIALGTWVLEEACRQLAAWHEQGFVRLGIGINVSPRQLIQARLADTVKNILATTGLAASMVHLEVTENIALQSNKTAIDTLRQLRNLGVGIVLDDFGLGHSSLGYLKQFSITGLKIDQSFVRKSLTVEEDAAIVKAIVLLAATLKLNLVAEGVETQEEKQFLQGNGCRLMQGFLFSKPVPAEEFVKLLAA